MGDYDENRLFEDDVRRTADMLFQMEPGECKPELYAKGGRTVEIDGVAKTRHITHLIMATTSTKLYKIKGDIESLEFASSIESSKGNSSKKWMIVEKPPEAPHVEYARQHSVLLLTMRQFRDRFFDSFDYLSRREACSFGSARDPRTGSATLSKDEFIEAPMTNLDTGKEISLSDITDKIARGESVVLVGAFGCGKSLTLRQVWFQLREKFRRTNSGNVPVAINLREHWGAKYADEIFRRHSKSIALKNPDDLTIAWRVGILNLLIDGFDEMASSGAVVFQDVFVLRNIRRDSLVGVRDIVAQSPRGTGILLTGRDHYFDDRQDLEHALGIQSKLFSWIRVEEFDDSRAQQYLRGKGVTTEIPEWLPKKPLLLGYLTRRDILRDVLNIDGTRGQARAWYEFVSLICKRESEHERSAMDADTVQQVLEDLAIQVRSTSSGVGPITTLMLSQAYTNVTGQVPADAVVMQLQRLPGLTERDADPGSRSFVDKELLETLQGLAIVRILGRGTPSPKASSISRLRVVDGGWFESLTALGAGVAVAGLRDLKWNMSSLLVYISQSPSTQIGADLLNIAMIWAVEDGVPLDLHGVELRGVHVPIIDLDALSVIGLAIRDSVIDRLVIGMFARESMLSISGTLISRVIGVSSKDSIPQGVSLAGNVDVSLFDGVRTNDSIVSLAVEPQVKALLTALIKLYKQRGSGRASSAFRRGLPPNIELYIQKVLDLLVKEEFAWRIKDVYHPARGKSGRVNKMIDAPGVSDDPLIAAARLL